LISPGINPVDCDDDRAVDLAALPTDVHGPHDPSGNWLRVRNTLPLAGTRTDDDENTGR